MLGDAPVTDTHEAGARLAALRAQVLAAESDVLVRRNLLANTTGLSYGALAARLPGRDAGRMSPLQPLEFWLDEAQSHNPEIRTRLLAADVARQEATKHGRSSSVTVDLVAQVGRDRLSGSGNFGSASNRPSLRLSLPR